jgi:hypothetical protein
VRTDEYEDPETGMSWRDGDCVDWLRVYNTRRLEKRREYLRKFAAVGLQAGWTYWMRPRRSSLSRQ